MSHARKEYKDFMSLTPDAYAAVLALGQVAGKAGMDKQLLELIKLRASQINGCAFCVQYHILESEKLGVPTDKLNLVVVWREAPQFSQRERAALAWTEALTLLADGVSDEVYAQASAEFSETGARLSHVRGRLDQCLEQVRRRVSLDAAGTEASRWRGSFVRTSMTMAPLARLRGGFPKSGAAMQRSGGAAPLLPADLRSPCDRPERCRSRHRWNSPSNSA